MINLTCEVQFANDRHTERLQEAEHHRLICLSTAKEENLLSRLQLQMMSWVNSTGQTQEKHNYRGK